MILAHHFVVHNGYDVKNLSLGPERTFFQLVMQGGGKVGVVIFFTISACKWYMKPFTLKQIWLMAGIGLGFFLLYTCASIVLSLFGIDVGIFITGPFKLPVIMVGFGIFLLFDRLSFHNRIINRIGSVCVRGLPDYRVSRHENIALEAPVRAERPLSAALRHSVDPRHPTGNLHCLHFNRFRTSGTVCSDRKPQPWPLARTGVGRNRKANQTSAGRVST